MVRECDWDIIKSTMSKIITEDSPVIEVSKVTKSFKVENGFVEALKGVDLLVKESEFIVIFGPSGCGKSTLLNIILGIDQPTSGSVSIGGKKISKMSEDERSSFRSRRIGMVHQLPYWVKSLNVLDNTAMPLVIRGLRQKSAIERAKETLKELGIEDLSYHLPTQLSGGQQQRAGVARAVVSNPWIIIADEPTGNLDSTGGREIIKTFNELNKKYKKTIILVTHNEEYWNVGTRRVEMKDGKIEKDTSHG